jgi:hypothetical protein
VDTEDVFFGEQLKDVDSVREKDFALIAPHSLGQVEFGSGDLENGFQNE